jgi:hypothetical protein
LEQAVVGHGVELWNRESVQVGVHRCGEVALGAVQVSCPQGGRPAVVGHDDGHDLGPGHPQVGQRVRSDRQGTQRRHRRLRIAGDPGEPRRAHIQQHLRARGPAGRHGTASGSTHADQRRRLGV